MSQRLIQLLGRRLNNATTPPLELSRTLRSRYVGPLQRGFCPSLTGNSVVIQTGGGQCLFVNPLSGDDRANLNPVEVGNCDGSPGQLWDIITSGVHDNVP